MRTIVVVVLSLAFAGMPRIAMSQGAKCPFPAGFKQVSGKTIGWTILSPNLNAGTRVTLTPREMKFWSSCSTAQPGCKGGLEGSPDRAGQDPRTWLVPELNVGALVVKAGGEKPVTFVLSGQTTFQLADNGPVLAAMNDRMPTADAPSGAYADNVGEVTIELCIEIGNPP